MIQPINQITEVLYELIRKRKVTHRNFQMQDFRKRISQLKLEHGLNLTTKRIDDVNKYGNAYTYVQHSLPESERQKAVDLYKKLVK